MGTIADIEARVLDRLEESRTSPQFWNLQNEVRPAIVEAMNEASLITGEPEVRSSSATTVPQSTTLQAMPAGALAIVRVEGTSSLSISKTSVWDLDHNTPGWQNDTGDIPRMWFALGLTQWGIYPQLTADVEVVLTTVGFPVVSARPYSGAETIPFQIEFHEALEDYASHILRFKEGGAEFQQSLAAYNRYLARMEELSSFGLRKGSLRFSLDFGVKSGVSRIEVR